MDLVELTRWEATAESRARFDAWGPALIHHEFTDVRNRDIHFTPLARPLAESRVALVSSGGMHLRSEAPFDILEPNGDWSIRAIPSDARAGDIGVSHSHYSHGDADKDVNCMFPLDRLRELAAAGFIGSVTKTFYGVMGFIPNGRHVVEELGPELARRLKDEGAEVVLLAPS